MDILDRTILNIFNLPFLDTLNPVKLSSIPDNLFGVFVTIHRHQKLKDYPKDIHGCIGYWDDNYKTIPSQMIYDKIMSVSKDAMYNDNRSSYFPPIETDPLSSVEINYMQKPLYKIDSATGLITELGIDFDNKIFGLIVHHPNGKRATYLPKVFAKISWDEIKKSIASKAGINNTTNSTKSTKSTNSNNTNNVKVEFYAYKTKIINRPIFNILSKLTYLKLLSKKFGVLVEPYYKKNIIPFSININGDITSNHNEVIRNTSVISRYLKATKKKSITPLLLQYFLSHLESANSDEQTIANVITLLIDFEYDDLVKEYDIQKLNRKLTTAEPAFEMPQLLIALVKYYRTRRIKYQNPLKYMDSIDQSDVFMLNWYSNLLRTVGGGINSQSKLAISLMNMFLVLNENKKLEEYETNYLAVIFEGMMHLYHIITKNESKKIMPDEAPSLIFRVFLELIKRYDTRTGTFKFLSGESRLDITCHILNVAD